MSTEIIKKLAELGVELPRPSAPAANYVPHVQIGDIVYVSGQVSGGPDGFITGKLGENMSLEEGA
ncbi:MAG: RidA family protein, partial [Paracoccaceae bacterium]